MLLPSMLREAVDPGEVDYQVAPGLANASADVIRSLDMEAARVAFLVDGDKAGRDKRKFLTRVGVPDDRIITLGTPRARSLVLEDLIEPNLYLDAVNTELALWHTGHAVPAAAIVNRGRVSALTAWCRSKRIDPPDKKRVAAQILVLRGDRAITTPGSRKILRDTHAELKRVLDRPTFT
jgi:hypothetical protein